MLDAAAISAHLVRTNDITQLGVFLVGIDSALRGCDLLAVRVQDIRDHHGNIRAEFTAHQRKLERTRSGRARKVMVHCQLSPKTQAVLATLVVGKSADELLFPVCTRTLRRWVKGWATLCGLDPGEHSGHSLRRTLPAAIYRATKDVEACRQILSHSNLQHTSAYLGISRGDAFAAARRALGHVS